MTPAKLRLFVWRVRGMMVGRRAACEPRFGIDLLRMVGTSERSFIKEGCREWLQFEKHDLCEQFLCFTPAACFCYTFLMYAAAAAINANSVHVLIDLSGWTIFPGVEVFAMKPAPLQLCAPTTTLQTLNP